jgi:hypothetical protein
LKRDQPFFVMAARPRVARLRHDEAAIRGHSSDVGVLALDGLVKPGHDVMVERVAT